MIELPDISATVKAELDPFRAAMDETASLATKAVNNVQNSMNAPIFNGVEAQAASVARSIDASVKTTVDSVRTSITDASIDPAAHLRMYGPEQASADVAQATEALQQIKVEQEAAAAGSGALGELNQMFGRGSTAGMLARAFEGAGPLLAIGLIGHELEDVTGKAAKLADEFRQGGIDAGDIPGKLAESVPVISDIFKSEENIREAITGQQAAIDATIADAKQMSDAVDAIKHAWDGATEATHLFDGEIAHIQEQVAHLLNPSSEFSQTFGKNVDDAMGKAGEAISKINNDISENFGKSFNVHSLDEMKSKIAELNLEANKSLPALKSEYYYDESGGGTTTNQDEIDAAKKAKDGAGKQLKELQEALQGYQSQIGNTWQAEAKTADAAAVLFGTQWLDTIAGKIRQMKDEADRAIKDAQRPLEEMRKQVAESGMSESAKKEHEYELSGASASQIQEYKKLVDKLDEITSGKKIDDEIGRYFESLKTPIEKAADEVMHLHEWFEEGRITLKQFQEAIDAANKKVSKDLGIDATNNVDTTRFAPLIAPDSAEALQLQWTRKVEKSEGGWDAPANIQAMMKQMQPGGGVGGGVSGGGGGGGSVEDHAEKQSAMQEKMLDYIEQIYTWMQDNMNLVVADIAG